MKMKFTPTKLIAGLFLGTSLLGACSVDDSYDLGDDIDMTMGLGSNGLSIKLGQTENIYMRDILDVDRNEGGMIDTTRTGMFYLVKGGQTQVSFNISAIHTQPIDPVRLYQNIPVSLSGSVPANLDIDVPVDIDEQLDITVDNIEKEVEELYTLVPENGNIELSIQLEQPATTHFTIKQLKDLAIEFPSFIHSAQFASGTHRLQLGTLNDIHDGSVIARLRIDSVTLDHEQIENRALNLNGLIRMKSDLKLSTGSTTEVPAGSKFGIGLTVTFDDLGVEQVSGRFNPSINPDIAPMEIGNNLPNFLKDENVRLYMSNPTLRISTYGTALPIPVLLSGTLTSWKNHQQLGAAAQIPAEEKAYLPTRESNKFYFFEGTHPFDPEDIDAEATPMKAQGLAGLLEQLPDEVRIDMKNGHITADPAARHTIKPGTEYSINVKYDILLPFSYNAGTCIVYTDSADNINKDIKDYQADGIQVTAKAINAVPLDMTVKVIPYDMDGNSLEDVLVVTPAIAKAGIGGATTVSDLTVDLTAKDRRAVSRIEKLVFHISANASAADALGSDQYIRLEDLRVKLKGQIIADFN